MSKQLSRMKTRTLWKAGGVCSLALLLGTGLGATSPAQAAPVLLEIKNGNFNDTLNDPSHAPVNYSYSMIHDASVAIGSFPGGTYYDGGIDLFNPINGTLNADLTSIAGTLTLSNITGTLTSSMTSAAVARFGGTVGGLETFTITGGSLSSPSGGSASGTLSYALTGALNSNGTFYFDPIKYLSGPNSPNGLTPNWLYLWGDNWQINGNNRPIDGSALGLDLSAKITPVPIPAAALLFGSGLLGLAGVLRRKLSLT